MPHYHHEIRRIGIAISLVAEHRDACEFGTLWDWPEASFHRYPAAIPRDDTGHRKSLPLNSPGVDTNRLQHVG